MKLCYPPKMNEKNDTHKKGPFLERKWIIFQLVWFSVASCYFSGEVFEVYTWYFFVFPPVVQNSPATIYTIHQFTVVFFWLYDTRGVWDASQKLADLCFQVLGVWLPDATAQPELGIWEWWIRSCEWSHVLSIFTRILKNNHPYDGKLFGGPRDVTKYFFQTNLFFWKLFWQLIGLYINLCNFWLDKLFLGCSVKMSKLFKGIPTRPGDKFHRQKIILDSKLGWDHEAPAPPK